MLHSFKHAAPASVRRPSQDGYRPRRSDDFRRTAHERRSLDARRAPRHSSTDLYRPPRRRASEPLRHVHSEGFQLTSPPPQGDIRLRSPKEEELPPHTNGVPIYPLSPSQSLGQTASSTAVASPEAEDGPEYPTAQQSIENYDINERPPPLPYRLWDHKLSIAFFWFLILAESFFVPIALYYGLIYGTDLREGALFAIITSVFGFVTGYEYGCRGYLLLKKSPKYRPLNDSPRYWGFDGVQWLLSGPYAVMTAVLIGGSIPHPPLQRMLATPLALAFIMFGIKFIVNGVAVQRKWRLKYFRMSSFVKGAITPPITYTIIEDIVAVDGGGGERYRRAFMTRYYASPKFRALLRQMTWFWGVASLVIGVVLMILIFTVSKPVAYGLGWSVPSIWAGIWVLITIYWVKRALREEKTEWRGPVWVEIKERADGGSAATEMAQSGSETAV